MQRQLVFVIAGVFAIALLVLGALSLVPQSARAESGYRQLDFDGVVPVSNAVVTGSSYMLYVHHGGNWADAEKVPPSDGKGNPPPDTFNEEDDEMCWAASASNILEWTGWGFVSGMEDADEMFSYFQDHCTDYGSLSGYAWDWWFDGTLTSHGADWSTEDVAGGNFWPSYTFSTYYHEHGTNSTAMQKIEEYLHAGYGVGLGIYPNTPPGGHAITCWGIQYDPNYDPNTNPDDYYLGIWVSDSDDDKNTYTPPDNLQYYEVDYSSANSRWNTYGGGWHIGLVMALEPFPGENRPVADAGGPYIAYEGSAVTFDGSGSTDDDSLEYRWDFDNDRVWDTAWSSSPSASFTWNDDYSGMVSLEVYDGRLRDVDTAEITVSNVAPDVDAGPDQTVDEGDTVYFSATATDPGSDTLTHLWDFGDGDWTSGTGPPAYASHVYGDDGVYTVTVTATDDEGSSTSDTLIVTVNNLSPTITPFGPLTVDENSPASLTASCSDPGSDDLKFTWVWEFGPTLQNIHYNDGIGPDPPQSPHGTYPFSATDAAGHTYGDDGVYTVTLTVEDDDGGVAVYSTTVTVNNVAPTLTGSSMDQPNLQFILPVVHTLDFSVSATDPGSDDLTFTWDWGDGSPVDSITSYNDGMGPDPYPSPDVNPMSAAAAVQHVYAAPGDYVVTLTVTDDDGGSVSAMQTVHVADAAEALDITNQYIQDLPDEVFKGQAQNRKNAFDNMFGALHDMLANAEYNGMIQDLLQNVRGKVDGQVDGLSNNDWIVEQTAQQEICQKIDDLTAYLAYLASTGP